MAASSANTEALGLTTQQPLAGQSHGRQARSISDQLAQQMRRMAHVKDTLGQLGGQMATLAERHSKALSDFIGISKDAQLFEAPLQVATRAVACPTRSRGSPPPAATPLVNDCLWKLIRSGERLRNSQVTFSSRTNTKRRLHHHSRRVQLQRQQVLQRHLQVQQQQLAAATLTRSWRRLARGRPIT
ncbi:unnamed protein product [Prorocentrum cordatum]|uniref:Uncharacterized protein n=1 Tax=Prorocentrum cordatum TaxID=2364126 RepID=A0ABN9UDJ8_9DINO|nr:unnamed protein product [Polarella glacialis]